MKMIKTDKERLQELSEVIELQRNKLKQCRLIMRENKIGHLYPGVTVEYEENMKLSMETGGVETMQALYSSLAFNKQKSLEDKRKSNEYVKKLLAFIEAKGFTAKELQDWLNENVEFKYLADEEILEIKDERN